MPFHQPFPRSFTSAAIREYAPDRSGLYGISNAGEWIYIGEADNIQEALLKHLCETDTALLKQAPTGFVFEVCDRALRSDRQDRLILEYEPTCNRHSVRHSRIAKYGVGGWGTDSHGKPKSTFRP